MLRNLGEKVKNEVNESLQKVLDNIEQDLKSLIHKKHRLWNHWIASRNEAVYEEYKATRKKVKTEMAKLLIQD